MIKDRLSTIHIYFWRRVSCTTIHIISSIKNFLNNRLTEKPVTLTAEKKQLVIVLPFLGKLSLDLKTRLKNSIIKNLPFYKVSVTFKSSTRISNFFQFKDKMPYCLRSNVVYKFSYSRCNVIYYGKTCQHLSVRVGEQSGFSPLTGKKIKVQNVYSSKRPYAFFYHVVYIDDFKILATSDSDLLNKNETSLPLYLFNPSLPSNRN